MSKSVFSVENILSIVIALALASLLFFGLRDNFDNLQANVLWEQQEQLLWDIVVNTYDDSVDIISNKKIPDVDSVSIMMFWNPSAVTPDFDAPESDGNVSDIDQSAWRANIFVNDLSWLSLKDSIFKIPVSGEVTQVTISDIVLLFSDGSSERASVSTR